MNAQIVFIVDRKNNTLIFLGITEEGLSINQQELSKILGMIVSKSEQLKEGSFIKTEIDGNFFLTSKFEKILLIVRYKGEEPSKELLLEINKRFIAKYNTLLNTYLEKDIPKFRPFLGDIKEIILKFLEKIPKESPKVEVSQRSSKLEDVSKIPAIEQKEELVKKSTKTEVASKPPAIEQKEEPITEKNIGFKPLIKPMKRDAYPEGIPESSRDEILFNEAQTVNNEYFAEYVEGMIFHLKIFLSISLTHHYEIYIDFSEYPLKPKIEIGGGLKQELGKNIDELLFFYRNWDTKIPPHIIEIIREIEAVLMKFKAMGKLSETSEMPESALPDLEPLPELPPLEKENTQQEVEPDSEESKDSMNNKKEKENGSSNNEE